MHADLILIILAAAVILAVVYRGLAWVYLPPRNLPGPARVRSVSPNTARIVPVSRAREFHTEDDDPTELCQECLGPDGIHCDGSDRYCDCPCGWDEHWADDWADQLHEINQLGKFGDLTRPVAHLTHYEVEALIRTLAVPEWVPDRYRMAA